MAQVTITINSRDYAIACGDGQEAHILKLARLLDDKAKLLTKSVGQINENMLLAMTALLLADELEDAKKGIAPQTVSEPQVIEKVVEKIVEVEKIVSQEINLDGIDSEISSSIDNVSTALKSLLEEVKNI